MPTIDFSEVQDLQPLPDGQYTATVVSAKEGISQNGNPKIDIQWSVEGGDYDGRRIFDTLTFTAKALFRVKATLKGLGFPENFSGDITAEDLIGKTAVITVTTEQSEGINPTTNEPYGPRNRVKKVSPVGSGTNLANLLQ